MGRYLCITGLGGVLFAFTRIFQLFYSGDGSGGGELGFRAIIRPGFFVSAGYLTSAGVDFWTAYGLCIEVGGW